MIRFIPFSLLIILTLHANAAGVTGSFIVNGDVTKFYPVTFYDGGNNSNVATELEIGRSSVHLNTSWHGAVIAKFRYHTYNWGNAAHFIDADLRQNNAANATNQVFIAGWKDATASNNIGRIVIWLRGQTTYYYKANYAVSPSIYDGVQNALPFQEPNGAALTFKTQVDEYVNRTGLSYAHTAYMNGSGLNYYAGSVGIGTQTAGPHKLAVEGSIGARKVKVQQDTWSDFVFNTDYQLLSLSELEKFIQTNRHLPGVPTEQEVVNDGVDLGEMDKILLQKIEELTLYMIELKKENDLLKQKLSSLER